MEKFFLRIFDFFAHGRRKWALIIPTVLALLFAFAATRMNMDEDIAGFLPYGSGKNHRQSQFIYKNLRMADKIMVILSADNYKGTPSARVDYLTNAADSFSERFDESSPAGAADVQTRVDASYYLGISDFLIANMPYYLEKEDYERADSLLASGNFLEMLKGDKDKILSPEGYAVQNTIVSDPFHLSAPVFERFAKMGMDSDYKVIGEYLFTGDSSRIVMSMTSVWGGSETKRNKKLVKEIEQIGNAVNEEFAEARIDYLGSPVIAVSNAQRMHKDAVRCSLLALLLIIILLGWYFKRVRPIILICVPVVFGVLFGLAWMGLFETSVSAIALSAGSVILGIGVDYALVYSTRLGFTGNARLALKDTVYPMLIGNITTVGAFFSLLVMSAAGMRDFGLFAAISLIGAILFVIIFLPHWVGAKQYKARESGWMGKWTNFRPEEKKAVVWVLVIASLVFLFFSMRVKFSGDFNKINYMTDEQKEDMELFNKHTAASGNVAVYAVAQGNTMDQALAEYEQLAPFTSSSVKKGISLQCRGIENFALSRSKQLEKISMWNDWKEKHKSQLISAVNSNAASAGFSSNAFAPFLRILNKEFLVHNSDYFAPLTKSLLKGYLMSDSTGKSMILTVLYTPEKNLKKIYAEFEKSGVSEAGLKAASLTPTNNYQGYEIDPDLIVKPKPLTEADAPFLFDSFSMTDEMINILQADFDWVLFICSFLVFGFLWFAFRRVETALTAFLPMVLSWIWITGMMGLAGVSFNIVNIILATFIFGLGDDYTIFIVEGLAYEYAYHKKLLASYKTGVTLSAITMFIGVGSLVFALHPAMRSLGEVAVIGMVCVVAMAFVLPPLLFRWLVSVKSEGLRARRIEPVKLSDILVTLYAEIVFFFLTAYLTIFSFFNSKKRNMKLHKQICAVCSFVARNMPRVKYNLVNSSGENINEMFVKPSVIVCNHQSHLDLIYLLKLSPKIIVLTNRWVYHAYFYGKVVRHADFISVENGFDSCVEPLQKLVSQGYSVAVFPEGTRSEDCAILPFHGGAFYLADKLHLDIIPIVFHGIGHVLPKNELIMRRGEITCKVLKRVQSAVLKSGSAYGEKPLKQAQSFRKIYVEEYNGIAAEKEKLAYLKERILGHYIYKGPEIYALARREFARLAAEGIEAKVLALPQDAGMSFDNSKTGIEAVIAASLRSDITVSVSADNELDKSLVSVIAESFGGRIAVL